ncbi:hypothetical protein DXG03_001800 [Asterophora parasitica]|uniref:GPI transamidase component PIG-T n=1 Tax=Asterophora parasitica TaxID=117018 RepID=A0A9P7G333_9AGAR|nr:hypothetical protein DXG03_001800 [Asterophora parasitica]
MRLGWIAKLLLAGCICHSTFGSRTDEQFDEELTVKSLRDGKVASKFSFKTLLRGQSPRDPQSLGEDDVSQHYTVFPLALGQILREYAVTELHLTLNAGNWNYDRWGYPEEPGVGTGAELWAWMGDGGRSSSGRYTIHPEPPAVLDGRATFDVATAVKPIDISLKWKDDFHYPAGFDTPTSSLSVQRTLRGSSQARGQLSVVLSNHRNEPLHVVYLETMPWLVQFYLHTMKIDINGLPREDAMSEVTYIPAVPHAQPATFQCVLVIPPRGTLHLTVDVAKAFLRYTEHPPDAQRGWDLPPAVFVPFEPTHNGSLPYPTAGRIYTPSLLVDLATPDFSMPYNVIIFTCSLIAFLFGSVFNLLTRKFVVVKLDSSKEE